LNFDAWNFPGVWGLEFGASDYATSGPGSRPPVNWAGNS